MHAIRVADVCGVVVCDRRLIIISVGILTLLWSTVVHYFYNLFE